MQVWLHLASLALLSAFFCVQPVVSRPVPEAAQGVKSADLVYAIAVTYRGMKLYGIDFQGTDHNGAGLAERAGPVDKTDGPVAPSAATRSPDNLYYVSVSTGLHGSNYVVDSTGTTVLHTDGVEQNIYMDLAFDENSNLFGLATAKNKADQWESTLFQIDPRVTIDGKSGTWPVLSTLGSFPGGDIIVDNGGDLNTHTGVYYFLMANPAFPNTIVQVSYVCGVCVLCVTIYCIIYCILYCL
jgi:hypothetical protein